MVLHQRFEVPVNELGTHGSKPSLADIKSMGNSTSTDHANDGAPAWVAYQDAVRSFNEHLGEAESASTEVRCLTERAEDVPGIVERRVFTMSGWRTFTSVEPELHKVQQGRPRGHPGPVPETSTNSSPLLPAGQYGNACSRGIRSRT